MERLVEEQDPERDAGERIERHRRGDGGRQRAGLERHLLEPERDGADGDQGIEVPVPEEGDHAVVEAVDGRLGQRCGEAEEDAGRGAEEPGAVRRVTGARKREQDGRDADACPGDDQPAPQRGIGCALLGLRHGQEQRKPSGDDRRADDLDPRDPPPREDPGDREREDDRRDQQGLDDDHASDAERPGLGDEAEPLRREAEQPHRLVHESQDEPAADRLTGLRRGGQLLQHEAEREQKTRHEGQDDVHAASVRAGPGAARRRVRREPEGVRPPRGSAGRTPRSGPLSSGAHARAALEQKARIPAMSGTVQTSEGAGGPVARQQHAPGRREQRAVPLGVVRRLGSSGCWFDLRDTSLSMVNDMPPAIRGSADPRLRRDRPPDRVGGGNEEAGDPRSALAIETASVAERARRRGPPPVRRRHRRIVLLSGLLIVAFAGGMGIATLRDAASADAVGPGTTAAAKRPSAARLPTPAAPRHG